MERGKILPGHYRTISGAFHQEPNIEHNNRAIFLGMRIAKGQIEM